MNISNHFSKGLTESELENSVAVIGAACLFPGAETLDEFWQNILANQENITFFTAEELTQANIPLALRSEPHYVSARGTLSNIDKFDAPFFGYSPHEAQLTDPQHRIFLEKSWAALESAGYVPEQFPGLIGVFAGMSDSTYWQRNLSHYAQSSLQSDQQQIMLGASGHYLATKVSYLLGLTGPSLNIATACSTALVAIATACQSLINFDCDMALAGGITITVPQESGYLYQESGILSPDGHCRPFDKTANGTVMSNGCGIVVLRRLADALRENDNIIAVIKGWAINNDGTGKVGFTAPSVNGQADCIAQAVAYAGIDPACIDYVETHGTGTALGDPIEITALTKGYQYATHQQSQYCAIGSIKANIGHTDVAAGAAGLIKTLLALKAKTIPPQLYCDQLNEKINFNSSPFYVNRFAKHWEHQHHKRTAAVNCLGFGGTNAHVILEEAPEIISGSSKSANVLVISAKTSTALEANTAQLASHLQKTIHEQDPNSYLADMNYTLQIGRKHFSHRRAFVYSNAEELLQMLNQPATAVQSTYSVKPKSSGRIIFGFTGQGTQYINMARDIYTQQPEFKKIIDSCCEMVKEYIDHDLINYLFPNEAEQNISHEQLKNTKIAQPVLFIIEYAIAKFLIHLGIKPSALIGHSLGEYVAAAISESISLPDALFLVAKRAKLMSSTKPGAMLIVSCSGDELQPLLNDHLDIAAHNSPELWVISGDTDHVNEFEQKLNSLSTTKNLFSRYLNVDYAFHSSLMDDVSEKFSQYTQKITRSSPKIPYISNVTGQWITDADIFNPHYWSDHIRKTVLFSEGINQLNLTNDDIFIEIGAGQTLSNLVKYHKFKLSLNIGTLPGIPEDSEESVCSYYFLLNTVAQIWLHGQNVSWKNLYANETRKRISLPTYCFDDHRYWIKPTEATICFSQLHSVTWERDQKLSDIHRETSIDKNNDSWMVFSEDNQYCEALIKKLNEEDKTVYAVFPAENFNDLKNNTFTVNPQEKSDYLKLFQAINTNFENLNVIHCWSLTSEKDNHISSILEKGVYSFLYLSQQFNEIFTGKNLKILVVTNHLHSVLGNEYIFPEKSAIIGPCRVIPQEQETIVSKCIDLDFKTYSVTDFIKIADWEIKQLSFQDCQYDIAYRGQYRWVKQFHPCDEKLLDSPIKRLKKNGVYLITGGLGGIGLVLALHLAKNYHAHLILTTRNTAPVENSTLAEIRTFSASLSIKSARVEDENAMQEVLAWIHHQFGRLDGVIHAAAVPGQGIAQLKTKEQYQQVLLPKLYGTENLIKLLQDEPLDFIAFFSSLYSITGYPGQVDYCSANLVMDAYANNACFTHPVFCTVMNWESWREVGMAAKSSSLLEKLDDSNSLSPREGVAIFEKIINADQHQVIISNRPLQPISPNVQLNKKINYDGSQSVTGDKNSTIENLVNLWQETLGIEKIGLDDNFYDLGGNSLMAISLLTKMQKKLGTKLSPAMLFEAKTIRALSEIINQKSCLDSVSPLVLLQKGDADTDPLFMFHPIGGTVFCYLPLLKYLHKDRTVYGVQDPRIENSQQKFSSLEDMATFYRKAIQKIQPEGPYYLCGSSFGATVAIEIASQLLENKESLAFIGLIDGWPIFSKIQLQSEYIPILTSQHQKDINFNDRQWTDLLKDRFSFMLGYHPKKIHSQLTLFRAKEIIPEYEEIQATDNHWSNYSNLPIEIYDIPGDHNTMLQEPYVSVLAEKIQTKLSIKEGIMNAG